MNADLDLELKDFAICNYSPLALMDCDEDEDDSLFDINMNGAENVGALFKNSKF